MEAQAPSGGDAIAAAIIGLAQNKAVSLATEELALSWGVDKEIQKLSQTLLEIQSVLTVAEEKQVEHEDLRFWLQELKEAAYDADDVLDEFAYEFATEAALRRKGEGAWKGVGDLTHWMRLVSQCSFSCLTCSPNPILFRRKIIHKIKGIREALEGIMEEQQQLNLLVSGGTGQLGSTSQGTSWPETTGLIRHTVSLPDNRVFGRENEKEDIINRLVSDERIQVSVELIVGMHGIGKTTLARAVFNDGRVNEHFLFKKWVYVGELFDVKRIIKDILQEPLDDSIEDLQRRLATNLKNNRFLIVLDDVWSVNIEEWKKLWGPLARGNKGGKIVVTTRSEMPLNHMGPMSSHSLTRLSDDDCWKIFENHAFVNGNSNDYPDLKEIGWQIVEKLKGNPLAVKVVGSLLCQTSEANRRKTVLEEIMVSDDGMEILEILRLSYQFLPPHLKHCFIYCSLFPRDWTFNKAQMVKLWIAEGFILPRAHMRVEDIGCNYFDDLLQRSFFQCVDGGYVMHDLIHDLAEAMAKDDLRHLSFSSDGSGDFEQQNIFKLKKMRTVRHLSFSSDGSGDFEQQDIFKLKKVRTLCRFDGPLNFTIAPHDLFSRLKSLRVLSLRYCDITELPNSIGELKHLRYLDLSHTEIKKLPKSLCSLYNLQTFKLENVCRLDKLPKGISNLINLRYLEADVELISRMDGIGKLVSLQELKEFEVIQDSGCNIAVLKDLNQIRGKLHIMNLENVKFVGDARQAMLQDKQYLEQLKLEWKYEDSNESLGNDSLDVEVLNGLQPPSNLKSLVVDGNRGINFPRWMMGDVPSKLESCCLVNSRWEHLPPLGQLRFLKSLEIRGMNGVKNVEYEFYGYGMDVVFPAMEKLIFEDMPEWESWVVAEEAQLFPLLRKLKIKNCPRLKTINCFLPPTLTKLHIEEVGLVSLPEIRECNRTVQPTGLALSSLAVYRCPNLKYLSGCLLPHRMRALQSLKVLECENLLSLWEEEGPRSLVCLQELSIRSCPKLQSLLPCDSEDVTFLSTVEISYCPSLMTFLPGKVMQHPLTKWKRMGVSRSEVFTSFGLQALVFLKRLRIWGCPKLVPEEEGVPSALSLSSSLEQVYTDNRRLLSWLLPQDLASLKDVVIEGCSELTFFTKNEMEGLKNLESIEKLSIWNCHNLRYLPVGLQTLYSLQVLSIKDCRQIQSLPELESLSSLNRLQIQSLPWIRSLPELQSLSSLKVLHINNCSQIQSLPERGLPASLLELEIRGCPLLVKRCKEDGGLDWHKIAHIPDIHIQ